MQAADTHRELASMLPGPLALRLTGCWPTNHFCEHFAASELPTFMQSPVLQDLSALERIYTGHLEVTRGNEKQYAVSGVGLRAAVEDLKLAVRLKSLEHYLPGAEPWLRNFEKALGLPVGACDLNAFYNAEGIGLAPHCDPGEHLLFHVKGRKHFLVRPNPGGRYISASHTLTLNPSAAIALQYPEGLPQWSELPPDSESRVLEPGSVLFIPRGCYHATAGGIEGVSGSLVIRFRLRNKAEIVCRYLQDFLMQSEEWREPIYRTEGASAAFETGLAQLARQIPQLDATTILAHAGMMADEHVLQAAGRLVRNPAVVVSVEIAESEGRGRISGAPLLGRGRRFELDLSADAAELVRDIANRRTPASFSELAEQFSDWDDGALASLVDYMVKHEIMIYIPVEPFSSSI